MSSPAAVASTKRGRGDLAAEVLDDFGMLVHLHGDGVLDAVLRRSRRRCGPPR